MPIKTYAVVPLLAAVALVQSSVLSQFSVRGVPLNLMLLMVVSWSLLRGAREGMIWGFTGGLALDFLSGAPLGSLSLSLTLTAYLTSLGQRTVYRTSPLFPSLVALVASVVNDSIFLGVLSMTGYAVAWRTSLVHVALPTALLGSLMIPLVYRPLAELHRRTMPEETEL